MIRSQAYQGKRVRLRCLIKTSEVEEQAAFFLRIDGASAEDVREQQLQGTSDWTSYEIELDIPGGTGMILYFGVLLHGKGQIWLANIHFKSLDSID